jgi:cell division protein FtsA
MKCVNGAKLIANDMFLQSLAAAKAVLTPEEMEMGVAIIDMGGGTTDMLVYSEGAPFSNASIPAGGSLITSDISKVKAISSEIAERIKIESGCCWEGVLDKDEDIIVPGVGGRPPFSIPRSQILAIIQPRMEEIFFMVKEKLDKTSLARPLGGGIVLTGGGSLLEGAVELASHLFKCPVRIGNPLPISGLVSEYRNPIYATAVGLLLLGYEREMAESQEYAVDYARDKGGSKKSASKAPKTPKAPKGPSIVDRFFTWLGNDFF